MERVLIVAKTHMTDGVCVGALVLRTNRHIRLLTQDRTKLPLQTPFEVGQIWNLSFRLTSTTRPHIESVVVMGEQFIGTQSDIRETLLQRIQPWQGKPWHLLMACSLLRRRVLILLPLVDYRSAAWVTGFQMSH